MNTKAEINGLPLSLFCVARNFSEILKIFVIILLLLLFILFIYKLIIIIIFIQVESDYSTLKKNLTSKEEDAKRYV